MVIGSLPQVMHENIIKTYYQKYHDKTPEGREDKWLAKVSHGKLADKHGKAPILGAIPGAIAGGLMAGSALHPATAIGAGLGVGAMYLKRKLHEYGTKKDKKDKK